jgi:putative transposase
MKEIQYRSNRNVVYSCKYHIIWCVKYRRKLLNRQVSVRLKEIVMQVGSELNVQIIELETDQDHIHILADVDPQFGVMNFVKKAKGRSSRLLRNEFKFLSTKLPTLWTNSCFISTVGGAPLEVIKQYIEHQQISQRPKEQAKWNDYVKNI